MDRDLVCSLLFKERCHVLVNILVTYEIKIPNTVILLERQELVSAYRAHVVSLHKFPSLLLSLIQGLPRALLLTRFRANTWCD